MSLMLRKSCQEALNKNSLSMFHADISSDKKLTIVSDCGNPLFTINGISFSKVNPSIAEIEFATELLNGYLIKHKTRINDYLSLITELADFADISYLTDEFIFHTSSSYDYSFKKNVRKSNVSFKIGDFKIKINESEFILDFELISDKTGKENKTTLTIPDLSRSATYKDAIAHMNLCLKHATLADSLAAAKGALNSCDI